MLSLTMPYTERSCARTSDTNDTIKRKAMKFPIGIQTFEQIIDDGYVYIDKTALIHELVHSGKIYFLSRPRRFGKSLLVSTLKAYFQGKKECFKGLAIDSIEKDWAEYPVFHIDFNGSNFTEPGTLERKLEAGLLSETGSPMSCHRPTGSTDAAVWCS